MGKIFCRVVVVVLFAITATHWLLDGAGLGVGSPARFWAEMGLAVVLAVPGLFYWNLVEQRRRERAEAEVGRNCASQSALYELARLGLRDMPLSRMLEEVLQRLSFVSWLNLEPGGAVYLEDAQGKLARAACQAAGEAGLCPVVLLGECCCGKAAQSGQVVFVPAETLGHRLRNPQAPRFGHYCVPMRLGGNCLGLLMLRLPPGRERSETEVSFLESVGSLLAVIIARKLAEAEKSKADAQFQQAQRLESVGLLAGGMAHDFNNVLTTIIGYNYFLLEGLGPGSDLRPLSLEIRKAADLAASLTRQVLAVTRKQVVQPRVMEPNSVILSLAKMFKRLLGENIKLELATLDSLWPVKMDCGQLEQVLMNLVVNARDAMPHGGKLTIATRNLSLREDRRDPGEPALPSGQYVCLEVRDTGVGMDESVRARLFEPFFTTKEAGRGTGLGLATVRNIVHDYRGEVCVESAPGQGSLFRVCLPRAEGGPRALMPGEAEKAGEAGHETVLVVEDNTVLRTLVKRILREKGYRVFSAGNCQEALALSARLKEHIDLLLCDLILPDGSGTELAAQLLAARPDARLAYMSGYPGGALGSGVGLDEAALIEKPFSPEALLRFLRGLLDRSQADGRRQEPLLPGLGPAPGSAS